MDARRELAQLVDGGAGVVDRPLEQPACRRGIGLPALARELQVDLERDEPLLRPVVEVAREAPALGVARLDDARARGAQRLQAARAARPPAARSRSRARRCRRRRGAARERRAAPRRGRARPPAARRGRSPSRLGRRRGGIASGCAVAVDVAARFGQPVGDVSAGSPSAARSASRTAARVRRELIDQPRDRRDAEGAAAHETDDEGRRQQRERGQERDLGRLGVGDARRRTPSDDDRRPEPEHRVEPAPLDPARRAPATDERARPRRAMHRRPGDRLQPPRTPRPRPARRAMTHQVAGQPVLEQS